MKPSSVFEHQFCFGHGRVVVFPLIHGARPLVLAVEFADTPSHPEPHILARRFKPI
jgi:hypothetical protein